MVKHIVMWRLKNESAKTADAMRIKSLLEGLAGQIPGMTHIEVGSNFLTDTNSSDVVLYSEFVDRDALDGYQQHPLHLSVVLQVKALVSERRVVDYEC
jgi:quinol monooxygenase YgiN